MCGHTKCGHCGWVSSAGAANACQLAAVHDGLALVKVASWALAAHSGQIASPRTVLLSQIDLVGGGKQREFVSGHPKDCFHSLVAEPECDDLSRSVQRKRSGAQEKREACKIEKSPVRSASRTVPGPCNATGR